ncbi:MAG: aromatic acid/H+ symport family MFS transporter [Peptococcaceae bacterium]|jgi:AAHS family benzoate transporter-like MFS transporter|nr:aromatic acid/H+ symport family MFS transporter [Peptococcaceae bacterium]
MPRINIQQTIDQGKLNKFFSLVYIICIFIVIFDGYDMNIFGPITPLLMEDLHLNAAQTGLLASYALYGMLVGSIVFGVFADKIGQKKAIMIGIVVYGLFTGLTGHANTPTMLGICRFIAGFGIGGVVPNVIAYVTEFTPKANRGTMTSWVSIGINFGAILAAGLSILFLQKFGWRFMFWIAYLPIIIVLLIHFFLPETMISYYRKGNKAKIQETLQRANADYIPSADDEFVLDHAEVSKVPLVSLFKDGFARNTILVWICYFMNLYMTFGINTWLPKLMMAKGYPLGNSLWLLLIFNTGTIIGTTFGAWAAPKYGYKKIIIAYYAVGAILICLLSIKFSFAMLGVILFIIGAIVLGINSMFNSYVSLCYPVTFRSTALGCGLGIGRLGGAAGPIIGGFLLVANVPMFFNFLAFAIPAVLGAIAIFATIDYTKTLTAKSAATDQDLKAAGH